MISNGKIVAENQQLSYQFLILIFCLFIAYMPIIKYYTSCNLSLRSNRFGYIKDSRMIVRFIFLSFFLTCPLTHGLSVEGRPWQADVYGADFIGIVRCIKPGGDYEVVEAWKHVGGESVLKVHEVHLQHHPGQEFLARLNVFSPEQHPKQLQSWNGLQSPRSWRVLPDSRYAGQLIELSRLSAYRRNDGPGDKTSGEALDARIYMQLVGDPDDLKKRVLRFVAQSKEEQEYDVLLASRQMRQQMRRMSPDEPSHWPFQKKRVDRLIRWMLRRNVKMARGNQKSLPLYVFPNFSLGGFHTLKALANMPADQFRLSPVYAHEIKTLTAKLSEEEREQIVFYELSPKKEFQSLKTLILQYLNTRMAVIQTGESVDAQMLERLKNVAKQVKGVGKLETMLDILVDHDELHINECLSYGGRETLRWLEENTSGDRFDYEKVQLAWRLGDWRITHHPEGMGPEEEEKQQIEILEEFLHSNGLISVDDRWKLARAIEILSLRRPAFVAEFLKSFVSPVWVQEGRNFTRPVHHVTESAYYFASYLGHVSPENSIPFSDWKDARDPFVQAAGAIYGSFEQTPASLDLLKDKAALPGVPGAWVSLALVRRGYVEFMTGALNLMKPYPVEHVMDLPFDPKQSLGRKHHVLYRGPRPDLEMMLREHLQYLGRTFEVELPEDLLNHMLIPMNEKQNAQRQNNYESMLKWWNNHKLLIADTRDPLIEALIAQRID